MPQPKKKSSSKKSPKDPLKKFRALREKERQNYRNKYPSKSEYEIQSVINENKRKEFGKVLEKSKKPPKTAMDSVRTMSDKSMKKDTMTQMKKKDMFYGGKKPMGYGGKKMENGGTKRKPAMRTTPTIQSEFKKVKNQTKSMVKKTLKKAPKVVKEVAAAAVSPVGYVASKVMKGKKFGTKTKVAPSKMKKKVTPMKVKKKVTPRMAMKKTIKKKTR